MKLRRHVSFVIVLAVLVIACGKILISQRQQANLLSVEGKTLRLELSELERLRAENLQLRASQVSDAELEMLRADHAALPRLRAEFEALKPR